MAREPAAYIERNDDGSWSVRWEVGYNEDRTWATSDAAKWYVESDWKRKEDRHERPAPRLRWEEMGGDLWASCNR
jgi:hypothetical protein